MKRATGLVSLSRDHHRALVLARALRRPDAPAPADVVEELEPHFAVEEAELVPRAIERGGALAELGARLLAEHAALRAETDPARLGDLLEAHVRFEERELFPALERELGAELLARLAGALRVAPRSAITGYHLDDEGTWVAELACGHAQHLRHEPPRWSCPWVLAAEGRSSHLGTKLACPACRMPVLPAGVVETKRTAELDAATLPAGLKKSHTLRAGTWGEIVVTSGRVRYVLEDDGDFTLVLRPGLAGIVAPERPHHVELVPGEPPARMYVRFLRLPE
jgi:tellurite resistance-related uncharacterized protein